MTAKHLIEYTLYNILQGHTVGYTFDLIAQNLLAVKTL